MTTTPATAKTEAMSALELTYEKLEAKTLSLEEYVCFLEETNVQLLGKQAALKQQNAELQERISLGS